MHFGLRTAGGALILGAVLYVSGCAMGPDYHRPATTELTPPDWRWKKAEPSDAVVKGNWWEVFGDPVLNDLESRAARGNQSLKAAVQRVTASRARARLSAADFFPELTSDPAAQRFRTSASEPEAPIKVPSFTSNSFSTPLDLSYEIDLWGRVRRSFEGAQALAQASDADYRNVLLTLQSDVALNYFVLGAFDSNTEVLERTIASRKDALEVQELRFHSGLGREIDYQQAKTLVASAEADLADNLRQREETCNQLALLCGQPASTFRIERHGLHLTAPNIPVGLPSSLLERRPDIAEAERTMAAKNAQIGVAYAAFFPSIRLTGQGGYLSVEASDLFNWENHLWSLGPSISLPILDGGRNTAELKEARASYDESVANYRESVLLAIKEVEDALLDVRMRQSQLASEMEATEAARRSTQLARERYQQGAATYLEVVDAERSELSAESLATTLRGQVLVSSVRLIKALGGGWLGAASPQPTPSSP